MNTRSAETIFAVACQKSPAERKAYLEEACRGDAELHQHILRLLEARDREPNFLEKPPSAWSGSEFEPAKPGDRLGRYRLVRQIGKGGWGEVYEAEQEEPIHRRVALKIIKLGMDTGEVIARFDAERQALALMDHPNVAKVFDAGATESGRPYFVMELVEGPTITDFCDQRSFSTQERLQLFTQVCHAVQHAHQKGTIHRDLKPSNILVVLCDGKPEPRVIDFGIARATEDSPAEKTRLTQIGQWVGTLPYMSPEQVGSHSRDIDTRSDIYSLGVVLYELLTGVTPLDEERLAKAARQEVERIIRQDEPPTPSTRLQTLGGRLTEVAHRRNTEPGALGRQLRSDLDWIVMMALEKDRTRRYESASALAEDIRRHLDHEPVRAAAPSAIYRFRKFARRNKVVFATTIAIAVTLLTGAIISTWQAVRASRAERTARTESSRSRQVAKFLKDMLNGVGPSVALGRDTTMVREILDKTAKRVGKDLKDQPTVEAELRNTIGEVYWALGIYEKAEAMLREALALRRRILGSDHPDVATSLNGLAVVLTDESKFQEAESLQREALAMRKRLLGTENPDVAESLNDLASTLFEQGKLPEAETTQREALAMRRALLGNDHPDVAASADNLGVMLHAANKLAEAEILEREALSTRRRTLGNEHPDVANSINNLAGLLQEHGKLDEAETMRREALELYRKLLGNEHPSVAKSLDNLAGVLREQGKLAEAETMHREALAMRRKLLGNDHPDVANSLNNLASVLRDQGKSADAETTQREALMMQRKLFGDENPDVARSLSNLAEMLRNQGKVDEAETMQREALAIRRKLFGDDHPDVANSLHNLGAVLRNQGKLAEAESVDRKALTMFQRLLGPEHPAVGFSLGEFGLVLREEGKFVEAEGVDRDALAIRRKVLGKEHPDIGTALHNLALVLCDQGKLGEAETTHREALAMLEKLLGKEHLRVAHSLNSLGIVLQRRGKLAEAETMQREALAVRRKLLGDEHIFTGGSRNDLASVLLDEGKLAEAEAQARDCLAIRERKLPDDWQTFSTKSLLGGVLFMQSKNEDAEHLLLSGYEGMEQREGRIPAPMKPRLREALQRLVRLYETTGKPEKASAWKKDLEALVGPQPDADKP